MSFYQAIAARAKSVESCICVGLDPDVNKLPRSVPRNGEGVLRYSGAFGDKRAKEDGTYANFVLVALESLNAGKPVAPGQTRPWGCGVKNPNL